MKEETHHECIRTGKCQETEGFKGTEHEGLDMCEDGCVWYVPMTNKKQTNDNKNKLIGEWMGLQWNPYESLKRNYHSNWNELMPVVAKISKMDGELELDLPITASISEVYEAFVTYIEWNKTTKP